MPTEGMCDNCPGRIGNYSLRTETEHNQHILSALWFYKARSEWNPIYKTDSHELKIARKAFIAAGMPDLLRAIDAGVRCSDIFHARLCKQNDEEWLEANSLNDLKHPVLFEKIAGDTGTLDS